MEKVNLYTYVKDAYFGPSDVRIQNCLRFYGVETLRQLVAISRSSIYNMRNMGKKSRMVIEDWLEERGLHLGMTKEEIAEYEGASAKAEEEQAAADTPEEHPAIKTEETPPPTEEKVLEKAVKEQAAAEVEHPMIKTEETPSPTEEEVLEKVVEEASQNQGINLEQEVFWLAKEIFLYDMRKHGYSGHSAAECAASVAVRLYTEVNDKLKKLKE